MEFGGKNAEASTLAGIILTYKTKNYDYALKYIEKGLGFNPEDSLRSELNYLRGVCFYRKKLMDEALRSFTEVIEPAPKKDSALFMSGIIYTIHQDMPEKGADLFSQLLLNNPEFDKARYYRGLSKQKLDQHDEAIDDFEQLIDRTYELGACYYHKARSEIALNRLEDACLDLQRAKYHRLSEAEPLQQLYCKDQWLNESRDPSANNSDHSP
jgi:tetratricopeptide (TPR) repeat protein